MAAGILSFPPAATVEDADKIRKWIVKAAFIQFNFFIILIMGALVWKGWEMPPTANSLIMLIVGSETGVIGTAVGYFLGSSASKAAPPPPLTLEEKKDATVASPTNPIPASDSGSH